MSQLGEGKESTPRRQRREPSTPQRNRYNSQVTQIARAAAQFTMLRPALWSALTIHQHGKEHVDSFDPAGRGFVVIANHSSHFDAPLLMCTLPRRLAKNLATGVAADYFFDKWYRAAPTALFFNAFPVERKSVRRSKHKSARGMAGKLLSDGIPLLIFPEGTRSRTGAIGPFTPGAAALCISRNVPALPIALVGAYSAWPHNQSRWNPGRPDLHVVFGEPMYPGLGEIAHQFNERMRRKVIELHDGVAVAYGKPTLASYARNAALERARRTDRES